MSDAAVNKARLDHAYRRWHETKGGCLDEVIDMFDEDVEFRSIAGGTPPADFTALWEGHSGLRKYVDTLLCGWTMVHYTVEHMIAEDNRVAVVGSAAWLNKATGKTMATPKVDIWEFRNGKAVYFCEYFDTAKFYAAATPG